jgi:hypothetical protein
VSGSGIGGTHKADRRAAIRRLRPGVDRCPYVWICGGQPMWPTPQAAMLAGADPRLGKLDLDHFPGRMYGGPQTVRLAHSHCNQSAGATAGNRARRHRSQRRAPSADAALNAKRRARWS